MGSVPLLQLLKHGGDCNTIAVSDGIKSPEECVDVPKAIWLTRAVFDQSIS